MFPDRRLETMSTSPKVFINRYRSSDVRRRQFLATASALLTISVAGCAHPPNVLDVREATPESLADEMSQSVPPESDGYSVIREAIENESATISGTSPPIDTDDPIRFQGRYYDASMIKAGSRRVTSYDIRVDYNPEATDSNESIAYADLPAVDKTALEGVIPPQGDPPQRNGFELGTQYRYPENATNASVLVPAQQYNLVRYQDSTYRIQVESETVTEVEYRYEVTEIASTTEAFADQLRSTYQFTFSELSSAEREIVEEAIDSGYFGEATDAFRSLIARFRAHRGLEASDSYGSWLVEYEETSYIAYAEFPPNVTSAPG